MATTRPLEVLPKLARRSSQGRCARGWAGGPGRQGMPRVFHHRSAHRDGARDFGMVPVAICSDFEGVLHLDRFGRSLLPKVVATSFTICSVPECGDMPASTGCSWAPQGGNGSVS